MASVGARGLGGNSWPRYISLSWDKACERSLTLKLRSWRSHGKVIEKILKFSGYTLLIAIERFVQRKIDEESSNVLESKKGE